MFKYLDVITWIKYYELLYIYIEAVFHFFHNTCNDGYLPTDNIMTSKSGDGCWIFKPWC